MQLNTDAMANSKAMKIEKSIQFLDLSFFVVFVVCVVFCCCWFNFWFAQNTRLGTTMGYIGHNEHHRSSASVIISIPSS